MFRNYIVLNKFVFIQESGEVFWRGNNQNATGTAFTDDGKPLLEIVLNQAEGNQSIAAEMLGINRGTLRKKIQHYRIKL